MSAFVRSEKDVLIAMALAQGQNAKSTALACQVTDRTVRRKLADPEFRTLVARLRGELMTRALGRLADNMTRAADAIVGLLESDDARLRLRTARALLSLGLRLRDSVDLNERIHGLEDELALKQGTPA
jgi:hypothetical protein